jgi:hypothetical protein
MLSVLRRARISLGQVAAVAASLAISACVPGSAPSAGKGSGSVQVALLVPAGSGQSSDEVFTTPPVLLPKPQPKRKKL